MVLGSSPLAEGGLGEGGSDVMLVPYHRFVLHSRLSPQDAFRAMLAQTSRSDARWFQGEVNADGFKVCPVLDHPGDYFRPIVIGRIQPDSLGSRIVVSMRRSPEAQRSPRRPAWAQPPGSLRYSMRCSC